jgi:hypothetical protein
MKEHHQDHGQSAQDIDFWQTRRKFGQSPAKTAPILCRKFSLGKRARFWHKNDSRYQYENLIFTAFPKIALQSGFFSNRSPVTPNSRFLFIGLFAPKGLRAKAGTFPSGKQLAPR